MAEPRSPPLLCSHWLGSGSLTFNHLALRSVHTQVLCFWLMFLPLSTLHLPSPLSSTHSFLPSLCKTTGEGDPEEWESPGGCLSWTLLWLLVQAARAVSQRMKLTPDKPDSQPEGWLLPYVEGSISSWPVCSMPDDQHTPVLPAPPNYHWAVKPSLPSTSVVLVNGPSVQEVNAGL